MASLAVEKIAACCWAGLVLLAASGLVSFGLLSPLLNVLPPLERFDYRLLPSDAEFAEKCFFLLFALATLAACHLILRHEMRLNLSASLMAILLPLGVLTANVSLQMSKDGQLLAAIVYLWLLAALPFVAARLQLPTLRLPVWQWPAVPGWLPMLLATLLLAALLWPVSLDAVTARFGFDMHLAYYLFGPALHAWRGSVPGLDFFAQYGVGTGWLLQGLIADTARASIANYAAFALLWTALYLLAMFLIYRWLLQSWPAALLLMGLAALLMFYSRSMFAMPSGTVLRHALLPLIFVLALRWLQQPQQMIGLAFALALGLFINTETGLIALLAVVATALLSRRPRLLHLLAATCILFALICLLAFGLRALSPAFYIAMLKPLWLYGAAGLNAEAMRWHASWYLVANILAPVSTLVLLSWRIAQRGQSSSMRDDAITLACCLSLLLYAKYLWRSAVFVWGTDASWHLLPPALLVLMLMRAGSVRWIGWGISACAVLLLLAHRDPNAARFGFWAWQAYPSWVGEKLGFAPGGCRGEVCWSLAPDASDRALIAQRVPEGEVAAILDAIDWAYLIETKRAPLLPFLPSSEPFTPQLASWTAERLRLAPYIFTAHRMEFQSRGLQEFVEHWLATYCTQETVSTHLVAWKCQPAE